MTSTDAQPTSFAHEYWSYRFRELAERHGVPGAQLGVLRGEHSDIVTHGVLRAESSQPVDENGVFQIGSITKVWTATVAMQLVDEGLLSLNTRIAEILPELRLTDQEAQERVTIWNLLTHNNGIDGDVFTDTGRGNDALERYVELLRSAVQGHPLGETWSYSNSGYVLLGRVIEKITGVTWDAAISERLITPLGLSKTSTLPEDALLHNTAIGHVVGLPDPVQAPVWMMPRSIGPAGLVNSTAAELLTFVRMHLAGGVAADGSRVLSAESAAAMAAEHVELPDKHTLGDSWGLGWIRFDWNGTRLLGHDGATVGQNAYLRVLPDQSMAVALLTNGGHAQDLFEDLFRELFSTLAGVEMPAPFVPAETMVSDGLGEYAGTYRGASMQIEAFEKDQTPRMRIILLGTLAQMDPNPVQEYELVPVDDNLYAIRFQGGQTWNPVTFYRISTGKAYVHFGARALPHL